MKKQRLLIPILCFILLILTGSSKGQVLWVETTQEDFKDGSYESNLYASHRGGGTMEFVPRFDSNSDGYMDIFTSEDNGPYVTLYWGGPGGYSQDNRLRIPTSGSTGCDISDLNMDGYADFVISHVFGSKRVSIYWGTPAGPNPSDFTDLPIFTTENAPDCIYISDPNKDGYLDIITDHYQDGFSVIFWGSATGYSASNRRELPTDNARHKIGVADLDKNEWLDLVFVNHISSLMCIYLGSISGFQDSDKTDLPIPSTPHGLSIADLNQDGFLDLVPSGYGTSQQYIYWGNPAGYSTGNRQILNTGNTFGGSSVADFNQDGFLDIVFNRGGGTTGEMIYWGSSSGYSDASRTLTGDPLDASGGFVADLNYDGDLDLYVHRWAINAFSPIYWGPDFLTSTLFPVSLDAHGMVREVGNVYTREYKESYVSSVFDAGEIMDWGTISWVDSLLEGNTLTMQVRSGNTALPDPSWSSWVALLNGEAIPEFLNARYLQYQVGFAYTNPANLPYLFEVSITAPLCDPIEPPQQRTQGYWRRQCMDKPHEDVCAYVDSIHALADLFDDFDCNDICDLMEVDPPENDMCRKAERQFMALLLNVASGKLALCNCLSDGRRVEEVIAEIETILSGSRDHASCERAKTLADEINTGEALVNCSDPTDEDTNKNAERIVFSTPNPFWGKTIIRYKIPEIIKEDVPLIAGDSEGRIPVRLKIIDVTGRLVKVLMDEKQSPGDYRVEWIGEDATGVRMTSGIYFYRLEVGSSYQSGKIILIR